MAGSYNHAVDNAGKLLAIKHMGIAAENLGDAYETIEEFYGMVWYLANGNAQLVEEARTNYKRGLRLSPGVNGNDIEGDD